MLVYMKPNKPAAEMTEEELGAFDQGTYEQIMKLMRGGDDTWGARRLG